MAKFTADSSIEPQILELLEAQGHECNTLETTEEAVVAYAMKHSSVIVSRATAYSGLLGAHKENSPCMIWIGPPEGSPMIAKQLSEMLENDADTLKKGFVVMMMPGRNQVLPVA